LTVNFITSGTAAAGEDYEDLGIDITFEAGSATATKALEIIEDTLSEGEETVTVSLASGTGYIVGSPATATVGIKDDDEEIIIDNGSTLEMTYVGTWTASKTTPRYWASDYHHDGNAEKGSKTATFTPNLAIGGAYQVFMRSPARSDYPSNVPVDIVHAEGTTTVTVNQRLNGGKWNLLGTFRFIPGTSGYVQIRTGGTVGYVIADAVKFVRTPSLLPEITVAATDAMAGELRTGEGTGTFTFTRVGESEADLSVNFMVSGTGLIGSDYEPLGTTVTFAAGLTTVTMVLKVLDDTVSEQEESVTVTLTEGVGYSLGEPSSATVAIRDDDGDTIVDNAMASAVTYAGTWTASKTTPGYWATDYHHDGNAEKGSKTATFTPTLPSAGLYQVYLWYPARSDYPKNVPVDIVHAEGTTTVTVNQTLNGRKWNLLGVYNFSAGTGEYVRIRTSETVGYVVVDAVKWVRVPDPVGAPEPERSNAFRISETEVRPSIRFETAELCLEWPATPGVTYRVLRSYDGGATWLKVFEAEANDSVMRFKAVTTEQSQWFRVQRLE
jgi:hypothetical protein